MSDSKHCRICGVELTDKGLTADCGGDCTLCMALVGDIDCMYTAVPLLHEDRERLYQQLAETEALRVCADHDANVLAKQLAACQAKLDAVMLEYCPEDMTPEQVANWEKHQVVAKEN